MNFSTLRTVRRALDLCDQLGTKPPAATVKAWQKLNAVSTTVANLDTGNFATLVLDALEAGRDPAADKAVNAAAVHALITANRTDIDAALADRIQQFVDTHAPALIESFRGPFDAAVSTLTKARASLGPVELEDTAAIVARGGDAAELWTGAMQAQKRIIEIRGVWALLAQVTRSVPLVPGGVTLAIVEPDISRWLDNHADHSGKPWQLLAVGHRLDLATPEMYRQRLDAIGRATRERQAAADPLEQFRAERAQASGRRIPEPLDAA